MELRLRNLSVRVGGREVVRGVSLAIRAGEIHALMGPNGSGKTSLACAIAGHSDYEVASGAVQLGGRDLAALPPEERARAGLFLSFQEPPEVGGVSLRTFLGVIAAGSGSPGREAPSALQPLGLAETFLDRFLNEGFSGGEKKKSELLQLAARRPAFAILDEVDTGLDVGALGGAVDLLRSVAAGGTGLLVISHSPRLFEYLRPDRAHVLLNGRLVASGGGEVIRAVAERGYSAFTSAAVAAAGGAHAP